MEDHQLKCNGTSIMLTKETALLLHQHEWYWIAKTIYFQQRDVDIFFYMHLYLILNGFTGKLPLDDNFLCEYASNVTNTKERPDRCKGCPLKPYWNGNDCIRGIFGAVVKSRDWRKQAKLAREIAFLRGGECLW